MFHGRRTRRFVARYLGRRTRRWLRLLVYWRHPERRSLPSALRAVGLPVRRVPGWKNRRAHNRFVPVGIMLHDTGWNGSLQTIIDGRPAVAGPLANLLITKDGVVHVVSMGCCHHAGRGSSTVLDEIRAGQGPSGDAALRGLAEDLSGNRFFYGIEVENRSDGVDPYSADQIEAVIRACVAIRLLHSSWSGARELHHREWARRKRDMRWRGDIRAEVANRLETMRG